MELTTADGSGVAVHLLVDDKTIINGMDVDSYGGASRKLLGNNITFTISILNVEVEGYHVFNGLGAPTRVIWGIGEEIVTP